MSGNAIKSIEWRLRWHTMIVSAGLAALSAFTNHLFPALESLLFGAEFTQVYTRKYGSHRSTSTGVRRRS